MADIMDTLKGMLGDDAESKIKAVLGAISSSDSNDEKDPQEEDTASPPPSVPASTSPALPSSLSSDSIGQIMKLKSLVEDLSHPNDNRSQLLMSLRPYMRSSRQKSIDDAIRLLNITKFSGLFR